MNQSEAINRVRSRLVNDDIKQINDGVNAMINVGEANVKKGNGIYSPLADLLGVAGLKRSRASGGSRKKIQEDIISSAEKMIDKYLAFQSGGNPIPSNYFHEITVQRLRHEILELKSELHNMNITSFEQEDALIATYTTKPWSYFKEYYRNFSPDREENDINNLKVRKDTKVINGKKQWGIFVKYGERIKEGDKIGTFCGNLSPYKNPIDSSYQMQITIDGQTLFIDPFGAWPGYINHAWSKDTFEVVDEERRMRRSAEQINGDDKCFANCELNENGDLYATRELISNEELLIDYGEEYWISKFYEHKGSFESGELLFWDISNMSLEMFSAIRKKEIYYRLFNISKVVEPDIMEIQKTASTYNNFERFIYDTESFMPLKHRVRNDFINKYVFKKQNPLSIVDMAVDFHDEMLTDLSADDFIQIPTEEKEEKIKEIQEESIEMFNIYFQFLHKSESPKYKLGRIYDELVSILIPFDDGQQLYRFKDMTIQDDDEYSTQVIDYPNAVLKMIQRQIYYSKTIFSSYAKLAEEAKNVIRQMDYQEALHKDKRTKRVGAGMNIEVGGGKRRTPEQPSKDDGRNDNNNDNNNNDEDEDDHYFDEENVKKKEREKKEREEDRKRRRDKGEIVSDDEDDEKEFYEDEDSEQEEEQQQEDEDDENWEEGGGNGKGSVPLSDQKKFERAVNLMRKSYIYYEKDLAYYSTVLFYILMQTLQDYDYDIKKMNLSRDFYRKFWNFVDNFEDMEVIDDESEEVMSKRAKSKANAQIQAMLKDRRDNFILSLSSIDSYIWTAACASYYRWIEKKKSIEDSYDIMAAKISESFRMIFNFEILLSNQVKEKLNKMEEHDIISMLKALYDEFSKINPKRDDIFHVKQRKFFFRLFEYMKGQKKDITTDEAEEKQLKKKFSIYSGDPSNESALLVKRSELYIPEKDKKGGNNDNIVLDDDDEPEYGSDEEEAREIRRDKKRQAKEDKERKEREKEREERRKRGEPVSDDDANMEDEEDEEDEDYTDGEHNNDEDQEEKNNEEEKGENEDEMKEDMGIDSLLSKLNIDPNFNSSIDSYLVLAPGARINYDSKESLIRKFTVALSIYLRTTKEYLYKIYASLVLNRAQYRGSIEEYNIFFKEFIQKRHSQKLFSAISKNDNISSIMQFSFLQLLKKEETDMKATTRKILNPWDSYSDITKQRGKNSKVIGEIYSHMHAIETALVNILTKTNSNSMETDDNSATFQSIYPNRIPMTKDLLVDNMCFNNLFISNSGNIFAKLYGIINNLLESRLISFIMEDQLNGILRKPGSVLRTITIKGDRYIFEFNQKGYLWEGQEKMDRYANPRDDAILKYFVYLKLIGETTSELNDMKVPIIEITQDEKDPRKMIIRKDYAIPINDEKESIMKKLDFFDFYLPKYELFTEEQLDMVSSQILDMIVFLHEKLESLESEIAVTLFDSVALRSQTIFYPKAIYLLHMIELNISMMKVQCSHGFTDFNEANQYLFTETNIFQNYLKFLIQVVWKYAIMMQDENLENLEALSSDLFSLRANLGDKYDINYFYYIRDEATRKLTYKFISESLNSADKEAEKEEEKTKKREREKNAKAKQKRDEEAKKKKEEEEKNKQNDQDMNQKNPNVKYSSIKINPSQFTGLGKDGDFLLMMMQPEHADALFIFNDNQEQFIDFHSEPQGLNACTIGDGNATIRPYQCDDPPRAAGIPTGMQNAGYDSLEQGKRFIDMAFDHIRKLLQTGIYNEVIYSADSDGKSLGVKIFIVADDVKKYIVDGLWKLVDEFNSANVGQNDNQRNENQENNNGKKSKNDKKQKKQKKDKKQKKQKKAKKQKTSENSISGIIDSELIAADPVDNANSFDALIEQRKDKINSYLFPVDWRMTPNITSRIQKVYNMSLLFLIKGQEDAFTLVRQNLEEFSSNLDIFLANVFPKILRYDREKREDEKESKVLKSMDKLSNFLIEIFPLKIKPSFDSYFYIRNIACYVLSPIAYDLEYESNYPDEERSVPKETLQRIMKNLIDDLRSLYMIVKLKDRLSDEYEESQRAINRDAIKLLIAVLAWNFTFKISIMYNSRNGSGEDLRSILSFFYILEENNNNNEAFVHWFYKITSEYVIKFYEDSKFELRNSTTGQNLGRQFSFINMDEQTSGKVPLAMDYEGTKSLIRNYIKITQRNELYSKHIRTFLREDQNVQDSLRNSTITIDNTLDNAESLFNQAISDLQILKF